MLDYYLVSAWQMVLGMLLNNAFVMEVIGEPHFNNKEKNSFADFNHTYFVYPRVENSVKQRKKTSLI